MAIYQQGTTPPTPREYPEGWPHEITNVEIKDGIMRIKTQPL